MSLKVLLADDSAAIKKVVQLSLQDFGVVLKTVGSGKDVADVAKSFQPDIAFVDVLLPQKTGYEVASELKSDGGLKKIPVIMLFSSFMAFDEAKFKSSGADDKLEKPFEVSGLRALVNKYVPKTASSTIARHFEFPSLYFDVPKAQPPAAAAPVTAPVPAPQAGAELRQSAESWSMASFEDVPDFSKTPTPAAEPENIWNGDSEWIRKDLGRFTVPLPEDNFSEDEAIANQYSNTNINLGDFLLKPQQGPKAQPYSETQPEEVQTPVQPDTEALAKEIRAQAREIIEKVVWKLVPDIATNIIKEEIARLLGEEK